MKRLTWLGATSGVLFVAVVAAAQDLQPSASTRPNTDGSRLLESRAVPVMHSFATPVPRFDARDHESQIACEPQDNRASCAPGFSISWGVQRPTGTFAGTVTVRGPSLFQGPGGVVFEIADEDLQRFFDRRDKRGPQ